MLHDVLQTRASHESPRYIKHINWWNLSSSQLFSDFLYMLSLKSLVPQVAVPKILTACVIKAKSYHLEKLSSCIDLIDSLPKFVDHSDTVPAPYGSEVQPQITKLMLS